MFGPDQDPVLVLVAWGLGLHPPVNTRTRHRPANIGFFFVLLDCRAAPFLQLPLAKASLLASDPSTRREEGAQHSRASLALSLARPPTRPWVRVNRHIPALTGEARLPRPHPLLPSGLLSCFLKPILFVFNIVIFCLMLYYSYSYYSFISLQ